MFDQDLEDIEIDMLTKKLIKAEVSTDVDTTNCICEFLHTSLFGYKRYRKVEIKQCDLLRIAQQHMTPKRYEHLKEFCDKLVPRWFIKAYFNEQRDDVEYTIYPDPGPLRPHHVKAVHEGTKAYETLINTVRQSIRIEFDHMWREYRKSLQNK